MLDLLSKLHAKSALNKEQIRLLRACPILSVKTDADEMVRVSRDEYGAMYVVDVTIDERLLLGGPFFVPCSRTKEVFSLLEALAVEYLDEVTFYSKILLPHLEEITAAGGLIFTKDAKDASDGVGLQPEALAKTENAADVCKID